jgi:hypothetical protein
VSAARRLVGGLALAGAAVGGATAGYLTGGEDERPLDVAVADDLFARSDGMLTEAEADCAAPRIVEGIGADRLDELGFVGSPDAGLPIADLTDAEERTFAAESYACVAPENLPQHLAEMSFPAGVTTYDERLCLAEGIADRIGPERTRDALTRLFTKEAVSLDEVVPEADRDAIGTIADDCFGGTA